MGEAASDTLDRRVFVVREGLRNPALDLDAPDRAAKENGYHLWKTRGKFLPRPKVTSQKDGAGGYPDDHDQKRLIRPFSD